MNLEVIAGLLEDTKINVTTALSGKECLDILRERSFDVIFLDQMMPGMSGVQTLLEIKKEKLAEDTPIIALTADAIVGARDTYIKEGFTDYLSKPVMYKALEAILHKYINERLIMKPDGENAAGAEEPSVERPVILVVSESKDKLDAMKELLGSTYKGVFVRDEDKASKYLEKHKVEFVIRDI